MIILAKVSIAFLDKTVLKDMSKKICPFVRILCLFTFDVTRVSVCVKQFAWTFEQKMKSFKYRWIRLTNLSQKVCLCHELDCA